MFGVYRKISYICHVKRLPLAIRAESREGARLYRHYSIIFLPKVLFDYPGRIPRGQDHIDTTQKR